MRDKDKLHISGTRIKGSNECLRKWFVQYCRDFDDGPPKLIDDRPHLLSSAKQRENKRRLDFGTAMHLVAENWLRDGTPPNPDVLEDRTFLSGIQHWPMPKTEGLMVEWPWSMVVDGNEITGTCDVVWKKPDGRILLGDHKTCKTFAYMLTEWKLRYDEQCMLYCYVLMNHFNVDEIDVRWVYYKRLERQSDEPRSRKVEFTVKREHVEKEWLNLNKSIDRMLDLFEKKPYACDVPGNRKACGNYGGCPFKSECAKIDPELEETELETEEEPMGKTQEEIQADIARLKNKNKPKDQTAKEKPKAKPTVKKDPKINSGDPVSPPVTKKEVKVSKQEVLERNEGLKQALIDVLKRHTELVDNMNKVSVKILEKLEALG